MFINGIILKLRKLALCFMRDNTFEKTVMIAKAVDISNSKLGEYTNIAHHASILNSQIGSRTSIGRYTIIRNARVGKYCAVSWCCTIGADAHPINRISGSAAFFQQRFGLIPRTISKGVVPITNIGNDVWIGCHSIIIAGITVGDGAVIGAGSIVTKDIEPYGIYVGVPARKVGNRFDKHTIERLLDMKWWNLSDASIKNNYELFQRTLDNTVLQGLEDIRQ